MKNSTVIKLYLKRTILLFIILLVFNACDQSPKGLDDILKRSMNVQVNPYQRVPLGGLLTFRTDKECKVEITIPGKIPVNKSFANYETHHSIPILGLYADTINRVDIKLTTKSNDVFTGVVELKTAAIPDFMPDIEITKIDRSSMEEGFHLVEMLIANNGKFLSYTIMFDDNGDIRWYMDMSSFGQITYSALRIKSGNWLYLNWIDLWELTDLGEVVKKEKLWRYAGNHDIVEIDGNKILMGGSKNKAKVIRKDGYETITRYDYVVEWDRNANKGTKEWDLAQNLDIDRSVYPADYSLDTRIDWFHINSIAQDKGDNSVLASGRSQGVVKVDSENNLQWILAPHIGWGKSGREGKGFNTADYLLSAIDINGNAYPEAVQQGLETVDDFAWPSGQHALTILGNGNLMLFDNGLSRNFKGVPTYSRAVEFKIDNENRTVQQVWEYGKARGLDMWSPITSDVDVLPATNNRLLTVGNIRATKKPPHAKMIEITYPENKVVFEAEIFFKDAKGTGEKSWAQFDLVFRGERYPLYRNNQ